MATPPPQATPLSASPGHAQLVAIGDRVLVHLADATLLVRAYGPDEVDYTPPPPGMPYPETVSAAITVSMTVQRGSVTVDPDQFAVRDENGKPVALTADPAGPTSGAQGTTLTLKLDGIFPDGDGIITWTRGGHDVVSWDFSVEID